MKIEFLDLIVQPPNILKIFKTKFQSKTSKKHCVLISTQGKY